MNKVKVEKMQTGKKILLVERLIGTGKRKQNIFKRVYYWKSKKFWRIWYLDIM